MSIKQISNAGYIKTNIMRRTILITILFSLTPSPWAWPRVVPGESNQNSHQGRDVGKMS